MTIHPSTSQTTVRVTIPNVEHFEEIDDGTLEIVEQLVAGALYDVDQNKVIAYDGTISAEFLDEQSLERKAFDDLDAINEIVDHALAELDTGELDPLYDSLQAIKNRAHSWEDPK